VLLAIAPVAGLGRVVAAAPDVATALGSDIAAALDQPDGSWQLLSWPCPSASGLAEQRLDRQSHLVRIPARQPLVLNQAQQPTRPLFHDVSATHRGLARRSYRSPCVAAAGLPTGVHRRWGFAQSTPGRPAGRQAEGRWP
jgi:hypothetical protein